VVKGFLIPKKKSFSLLDGFLPTPNPSREGSFEDSPSRRGALKIDPLPS